MLEFGCNFGKKKIDMQDGKGKFVDECKFEIGIQDKDLIGCHTNTSKQQGFWTINGKRVGKVFKGDNFGKKVRFDFTAGISKGNSLTCV